MRSLFYRTLRINQECFGKFGSRRALHFKPWIFWSKDQRDDLWRGSLIASEANTCAISFTPTARLMFCTGLYRVSEKSLPADLKCLYFSEKRFLLSGNSLNRKRKLQSFISHNFLLIHFCLWSYNSCSKWLSLTQIQGSSLFSKDRNAESRLLRETCPKVCRIASLRSCILVGASFWTIGLIWPQQ